MSTKINLEDVITVLRQYEVEEHKRQEIIKTLEAAIEEEKLEKAVTPRKKSFFFAVAPDGTSSSQYLFKAQEDFDLKKIDEIIGKVKMVYNSTKKGIKTPARTTAQVIEFAKKKFWKEHKLQIIKNEPLLVIQTK